MLVYRIAKLEEIEKILNGKEFKNLGKIFKIDSNINNHQYSLDIRYLHFFKDWDSFVYLRHENNYLCVYDIDEDILNRYEGTGYYLDAFLFRDMVNVCEYAIPSELISFDNLISVELVTRDLEAEELIYEIKDAFVLKYKRKY